MGVAPTNALDAAAVLSYSCFVASSGSLFKEFLDRAVRFSFVRYAYRYRFSFTGERAGETCTGEVSKTS